MDKFTGMVERVCREMDKIAGVCVVGVMALVVCNILMRKFFKQPILGAYELVGYLTALGVSLALARCAFEKAHIALEYIQNKFPGKLQTVIKFAINLTSLGFWSLCAWSLGKYAQNLMENGVVSPTAQLPLYPVVLLIAFGLLGLSLVSLVRLLECSSLFLTAPAPVKLHSRPANVEYARKAVR